MTLTKKVNVLSDNSKTYDVLLGCDNGPTIELGATSERHAEEIIRILEGVVGAEVYDLGACGCSSCAPYVRFDLEDLIRKAPSPSIAACAIARTIIDNTYPNGEHDSITLLFSKAATKSLACLLLACAYQTLKLLPRTVADLQEWLESKHLYGDEEYRK